MSLYQDQGWLYQRYWQDECTTYEMADEAGCSHETVRRWMNHYGIARRGPSQSLEERFWSKVDVRGPGECWEWLACTSNGGYGQIRISGHDFYAHRVAWDIVNGPIPEGVFVCHCCDNPGCCNPTHLFLGTAADNNADMASKNRSARGPRVASAKLTEHEVLEIRRLWEQTDWTQAKIARMFEVSDVTISVIVRRKGWKWL